MRLVALIVPAEKVDRESNPLYEEPKYEQSEAAPMDDTVSGMMLIDIDGDNDKDVIIGDVASYNSLLVINGGTNVSANMVSQDTVFPSMMFQRSSMDFYYHSYLDIDNDGARDLLVHPNFNETMKECGLYRNVNTDAHLIFEFVDRSFLQSSMIEGGENVAPVLYDYNNDGLLDLILGFDEFVTATSHRTGIRYYKNIGTVTMPAFELIDSDVATISQFNFTSPIYPSFGDMDGDGDKDMIIGNEDGRLAYFVNNGGPGNV
ncbi:MAG: VCBS repeat-containing protein [Bacteroidetes bacterium]|nr:VCBS repeat-containing protein [Bacteroidota bacterium]